MNNFRNFLKHKNVFYTMFLSRNNDLVCRSAVSGRLFSSLHNSTTKLNLVKQIPSSSSCLLTRFYSQDSDNNQKNDAGDANTPLDIGSGTWKEIYSGLLSSQVKLVKSFSLGTTLIGLSIQPVIINYLGSSLSLVLSFSTLIGMFTFVTPALIHMFTRKYVFKLQYDENTDLYKATTLSFFLREKVIQFKLSDVTVPELPRMFTTFIVNKKPLFVDMDTFKDVEHFGRIMGYDKPIDYNKFHREDENKSNNEM